MTVLATAWFTLTPLKYRLVNDFIWSSFNTLLNMVGVGKSSRARAVVVVQESKLNGPSTRLGAMRSICELALRLLVNLKPATPEPKLYLPFGTWRPMLVQSCFHWSSDRKLLQTEVAKRSFSAKPR